VVRYRPDRRPELAAGGLSASTALGLRLVVTGPDGVACDVEAVTARDMEVWRDLLGAHLELAGQLARLAGEPFDHAATRLWTALECAAKLGRPDPRLRLVTATDHVVALRAGTIEVTSLVCQVTGQDRGLDWIAIAVATSAPSMTAAIEVAS